MVGMLLTGDDLPDNAGLAIVYSILSQGFFVKSNSSGSNFSFSESLQKHQAIGVFSKSEDSSNNYYIHVKLKLSSQTSNSSSDILYVNSATKGWDNGLDATIFDGVSNTFAIYSQLVEDNQGQNLGIQSLSNNNFDEVISIGINARKEMKLI